MLTQARVCQNVPGTSLTVPAMVPSRRTVTADRIFAPTEGGVAFVEMINKPHGRRLRTIFETVKSTI
jgi:hypothetical protein